MWLHRCSFCSLLTLLFSFFVYFYYSSHLLSFLFWLHLWRCFYHLLLFYFSYSDIFIPFWPLLWRFFSTMTLFSLPLTFFSLPDSSSEASFLPWRYSYHVLSDFLYLWPSFSFLNPPLKLLFSYDVILISFIHFFSLPLNVFSLDDYTFDISILLWCFSRDLISFFLFFSPLFSFQTAPLTFLFPFDIVLITFFHSFPRISALFLSGYNFETSTLFWRCSYHLLSFFLLPSHPLFRFRLRLSNFYSRLTLFLSPYLIFTARLTLF